MKRVCLIGRPNTGKSSLFNLMINEKKAIIDDQPGVTRDRLYGHVEFNNKVFSLIDTGGIDLENADFNVNIRIQAEIAIDEADVILFVVDGRSVITANDIAIRDMLRKSNKRVILVINKIDADTLEQRAYDFYELGINEVITTSVESKRHIKELLTLVTRDMEDYSTPPKSHVCRFSIIGRPNVGKSSLVNAILNEDRQIVSDVAGTTRDSTDTEFIYDHDKYIVVDTAGMRKRGKIYENIERYSLLRSLSAIDSSDICVIVIDAQAGIIEQDKHIVEYALDAHKGVVLVINKWDLIDNKDEAIKKWKELIKYEFQFIPYAPVVFLSAATKARVHTLMPAIIKAYQSYTKEIPTSIFNDIIRDAQDLHEAPSYKNRRLKIYFASQTDTCPPKFTFNVNDKGLVHFSYKRYLENKIRESIDLEGTPIIIKFKNRDDDDEI
ncbi:MAG TPA: ribosome biogenesis GTPase Der [Bacilli bacterium]|jgi:GTP-binding protein|nr:ribosome biogenesis GTPase Der [Bacilli bacterium]HPZ23542.1 ribosome biogenesis GTPase Der [Bacilli bacterium]HQC83423.1 ribosome biogenesis GTPase Der [Bacilli bacterium]